MTTIGSYQAKTHFSELIARVRRGERITITHHGVPVAMLTPVQPEPAHSSQEVIAAIKAFRQRHRLGDVSIQQLIAEGRE